MLILPAATNQQAIVRIVCGRVARTPIEVDLGLPLKHPVSTTEYSESVRKYLRSVQEVAPKHLEQSSLKQKATGPSSAKWQPLAVGQSVWVRRPKKWKFGRRWVGPYRTQGKAGVNYVLRSKEGKDMVVHHNNVKACSIPFEEGEIFCPVKESGEAEFLPGVVGLDRGNMGAQVESEDLNLLRRPAHLRQDVRPPLWFEVFWVDWVLILQEWIRCCRYLATRVLPILPKKFFIDSAIILLSLIRLPSASSVAVFDFLL